MLIASLVEFAFAKPRMRQTHNSHLANFDMTSFTNVDECGNILTVPSSLPICCSCTGSRTSDLPHKTKAQWTCKALTYVSEDDPCTEQKLREEATNDGANRNATK